MDDRALAKLLTQAGQDPGSFVGTASQMNADGTVTITGANGTVTAIAQTAFRSGTWSVKRVGNTWYAWSENSPVVESESQQVRRSSPSQKKDFEIRYILLLDSNFSLVLTSLPASSQKFLENLLLSCFPFKPDRLYTLVSNPGEGISTRESSSDQMINFFKTKLTVNEISVSQLDSVDSLFYLPVFTNYANPFDGVSEPTISAIKKIAKRYGVILQGENQFYYNPVNTFLMDKFYKPFHPSYDFVFEDGKLYGLFGGPPWKPYTSNKTSKTLFDGVSINGVPSVGIGDSAGIPINIIPARERLALFEDQAQTYVSVVGWGVKK